MLLLPRWHSCLFSVKTGGKITSICNETPKFCDLLVLYCLNVLCNYYVIVFEKIENLNYLACYVIQRHMLSETTCGTIFNFRKLHSFQKSFCPADLFMKGASAPAYLTSSK